MVEPSRPIVLAVLGWTAVALVGCGSGSPSRTSAPHAPHPTAEAKRSPTAPNSAPTTTDSNAPPAASNQIGHAESGSPEKRTPEESPAAAPPDEPPDNGAPADVAAPPSHAKTTPSGLAYVFLSPSNGLRPGPNDTVKVHYTGWTTDGVMFDSSRMRGRHVDFPLTRVIPGWTEGLQLMGVGSRALFWIPAKLAYKGRAGAPQGMLVFDIELLEVTRAPQPPPDVAAPPSSARRHRGVHYRVLTRGTGTDRPRSHDRVEVHYTGWTTDGVMFDSSRTRGRPATFGVNHVIPGWGRIVQRMHVGDEWRVWIPEKLAFKGASGKPTGMLVFDIELLSIERHVPSSKDSP